MSASVEHAHKAESFRSRADNIEAAADRAIYSDDPDAIEKLKAKIAKLEGARETVKTANAAYRKEHKVELKGLTFDGRDKALPYPSYVLTNLSGVLNTTKKRLARLESDSSREAAA
jgi:hypothetical protein